MTAPLTTRARAKINLTLRVLGRRADGYHELESLVAFAGTGDALSLEPGPELSLTIDGPRGQGLPVDDSNLILRATRALEAETGPLRAARSISSSACRWRPASAAARPMPPRRCACSPG